jgi:hypothetical protein
MTLKTRIAALEAVAPTDSPERVTIIERWIHRTDGTSQFLGARRDLLQGISQYFDEAGNVTSESGR